MKAIKNFYTIISLIVLMILRPFSPGEWFGSIAIAGLFVTWMDTIQKIWKTNNKLTLESEKVRYAVVMLILSLIGLIQLILIIVNLIVGIGWLNLSVVLDELTLLALLACLAQTTLVEFINNIIKNDFKDDYNGKNK